MATRINYGKSSHGSNRKQKIFNNRVIKNLFAHRRHLWLHPSVPLNAPKNSRRRMTVFYSGRVQGVGFRYTTKTVAAGFEIVGIVRNLPDGRVELTAEGLQNELEEFRAALRDAGLAGFIRDEQVTWTDANNEFRGFEIAR
jgi:acylphosphatase